MILRIVLFGLILCGLGGFGTIAWVMVPERSQAAAAVPVPVKVAVLTAAKPLHPGTLLQPEDIGSSEVETDKVPEGAVTAEADNKRSLIGGLVLHPLSPGDVLRLPGDALRPTDHGFLSAVLSPGKRAVTVGVDVVSGAAGLIWPGDRVDLILTQSIEDPAVAPGQRVAAETILHDARVIAIDQQIAQGGPHGAGDSVAKTVTLEVTPSKAQSVQVATRLGRLSLTLCSASGEGFEGKAHGTTWASDVSAAIPTPKEGHAVATVIHVFQGGGDSKEYRF